MQKIRVLMIKPKKRPKVCYIAPTIKAFKRVINADSFGYGRIQSKGLEQGVYAVFNKDNHLSDNAPNRHIKDRIITGTMLIVATNEKKIPISLTDDKLSKYSLRFWNIETFDEK